MLAKAADLQIARPGRQGPRKSSHARAARRAPRHGLCLRRAARRAQAYASRHDGCMDRVFFVGGFVGGENALARRMIAESMGQVGGRALFCRHSEFLGALGSLTACFRLHTEDDFSDVSAAYMI